jgi:hypothetical protein
VERTFIWFLSSILIGSKSIVSGRGREEILWMMLFSLDWTIFWIVCSILLWRFWIWDSTLSVDAWICWSIFLISLLISCQRFKFCSSSAVLCFFDSLMKFSFWFWIIVICFSRFEISSLVSDWETWILFYISKNSFLFCSRSVLKIVSILFNWFSTLDNLRRVSWDWCTNWSFNSFNSSLWFSTTSSLYLGFRNKFFQMFLKICLRMTKILEDLDNFGYFFLG